MPGSRPTFTADPPSEPGLYWYQLQGSQLVRHCRVILLDGQLYCPSIEGELHHVSKSLRLWAGPLLEPEGGIIRKPVNDVRPSRRKKR